MLTSQIESLKSELGRKDAEICRQVAHVESLRAQSADHEQLTRVLREQIQAKEQQCAHIQHDVSDACSRFLKVRILPYTYNVAIL